MEPPPDKSAEHEDVEDAREATNQKLTREREETDRHLHAKLSRREHETDETLDKTRAQVDRSLQAAKARVGDTVARPAVDLSTLHRTLEKQQERLDDALSGAPEPGRELEQERTDAHETLDQAHEIVEQAVTAEQEKARAAVAQIAQRTDEVLEAERRRTDEETEREREAQRRIFQEVLERERHDTDYALASEREISDQDMRRQRDALAMIGHDLRNLLSSMMMRVELLNQHLSDAPSKWKKLAEDLRASSELMIRWTRDLVDLGSLNAGAFDIQVGIHDPAEVMVATVQLFLPLAAKKGLRLEFDIPERRTAGRFDRDQIMRVFTNLLDNAVSFTPPSGKIVLRLESADGELKFSVSDTGPGMPEAVRTRIFERYWHAIEHGRRGSGLGLYITQQIIVSHGGRIWVESEVGKGSTFYFTLPVQR
jgi:signal transduction histidine kinase